MSSEPEIDLERLFAAEESAIRDDGFSARVMEQAKPAGAWRRPVIYGAGLVGAGFALGGFSELAPHLKLEGLMSGLTDSVSGAIASADLAHAAQGIPDPILIGAAAVVAGVSFLIAAVSLQSR